MFSTKNLHFSNITISQHTSLAHSKNELMQWRGVRRLSVRPSVNFCTNRFFSQANGRIATKLAHDGLQVSVHPGCAQGQGQRSHDTCTFLDSWNDLLRHWRSGFKYCSRQRHYGTAGNTMSCLFPNKTCNLWSECCIYTEWTIRRTL